MSKPRYIDMDFDEALTAKWESGRRFHRKNDESEFVGDPVEELFQELLDATSYVNKIEASGPRLQGFRTVLRNMALEIQSRKAELTRRI